MNVSGGLARVKDQQRTAVAQPGEMRVQLAGDQLLADLISDEREPIPPHPTP